MFLAHLQCITHDSENFTIPFLPLLFFRLRSFKLYKFIYTQPNENFSNWKNFFVLLQTSTAAFSGTEI
jgi:hypothetical protein